MMSETANNLTMLNGCGRRTLLCMSNELRKVFRLAIMCLRYVMRSGHSHYTCSIYTVEICAIFARWHYAIRGEKENTVE